jgi:molybdopterin biosynthesis enzyme
MRHLLLMARRDTGKQKFLCGTMSDTGFVCAVPGESVSNVVNAMEALQPRIVRGAVRNRVKRVKNRLRRRNKAFVRQENGSLFRDSLIVDPRMIIKTNR